MEKQEVITVLESLANGIDPATGAQIPYEAFHTAGAVRALFAATSLLKEADGPRGRNARTGAKLASAGAPWSADEDARLASEFDAGLTVAQMALAHGRSSSAITLRLVKLGRIEATAVKSRERGAAAAANAGTKA
jgi:hypothetical protein